MVNLANFTGVFSGDIKKKSSKKKKKSSENDQSTGQFQSFFIIFFSSPDPRSEKKIPVNQLIKKFWPYVCLMLFVLFIEEGERQI